LHPAGAAQLTSSLSAREERKKFLSLACACDRVELALTWQKASRPLGMMSGIVKNPWLQVATASLTPFLPRKLRLAGLLYRLWKAKR
jgi:hypothetical protein